VSFDVAHGWDIADEWCLGKDCQSCTEVEKVRADGVVTEPFLLPFANQIHGPSQRSFGILFSAFTLPNVLPVLHTTNYYIGTVENNM
jgi:hypothetical protein